MVSIHGLSKYYGKQILLEDASFSLHDRERVGLIGRNGHGKTTLFRMITGEEESDEGRVVIPNNYRIGYLKQHAVFDKETVREEALESLEGDPATEGWKAEKILFGLGFSDEDLSRAPSEFSGGYQMRINLAKVLVSEPDLLMLDEPTNFLDILSIRWLEGYLKRWAGDLIVISHDRRFLDSFVTHILGIHRRKVKKISGTTQKYYDQLEMEEVVYEKKRVNEEKARKHMTDYVNKFRAKARHAGQAQARLKSLEKMEQMDKLAQIRTIKFSFNAVPSPSHYVVKTQNLQFSYDEEKPYLIDKLSFTIEKHDKVCVVGPNGQGKTTLMRLLAERLTPQEGTVKDHPKTVKIYYEQANTAQLTDENTIEDEILRCHPTGDKGTVRSICGALMFSGDDALKKISVLSGGEKSRVLLGKLLVTPSNLLLLDEPTHHLDMQSCKAMINAVSSFDGAAMVVTHDEQFIHEVATKLIVFKGDKIIFFPGTYKDFLDRIGWEDEAEKGEETSSRKAQAKARKNLTKKNNERCGQKRQL